jgi:hypothetical protein
VRDLQKIMKGAWEEFQILREVTNNARDEIWYRLNEKIQENTKTMCDLQDENRKAANALEVMQVSLGGLLAFAFLDRLTGEWTVLDSSWATSLSNLITGAPALWFVISLLFWSAFAGGFLLMLHRWQRLAKGTVELELKIHKRVVLKNLQEYISTKVLDDEHHRVQDGNHVVKVGWTEPAPEAWGGYAPHIEITFDHHTSFMLHCTVQYNRKQARKYLAFNSEELTAQLFEEMHRAKVFEDPKFMPSAHGDDDKRPGGH